MDPDANLREQLELANWLIANDAVADDVADHRKAKAERLADLVEALNGWLTAGGFLPTSWEMWHNKRP